MVIGGTYIPFFLHVVLQHKMIADSIKNFIFFIVAYFIQLHTAKVIIYLESGKILLLTNNGVILWLKKRT